MFLKTRFLYILCLARTQIYFKIILKTHLFLCVYPYSQVYSCFYYFHPLYNMTVTKYYLKIITYYIICELKTKILNQNFL